MTQPEANGFTPITLELRRYLQGIFDLGAALGVLHWDMTTHMPPAAGPARARQIAILQSRKHELATAPELGRLLEQAEQAYLAEHPAADLTAAPSDDDGALLRQARRQYDKLVRIPTDFTAEAAAHTSRLYTIWTDARAKDDFGLVQADLTKTLELSRRFAGFFENFAHPADALIDVSDYGMSVAVIRPVFRELGERLAPLVKQIGDRPRPRVDFLHRRYPAHEQLAFGAEFARALGYDFERGRLDTTAHPFMTKFAYHDVRITTRVDEHNMTDNLFGIAHEVGHALYEQGIAQQYEGTPLHDGASSGVHESQSRLWENLVGRSRPFWEANYPQLQAAFPDQLGDVGAEEFYAAINLVRPSLIRTEADEVTYNLHVIIRFELECRMLEGSLSIAELPQAWRDAYEEALGMHAPSDADGVLQDVHWFAGFIGGSFQGYALGNIMACQFFQAAQRAAPELTQELAQGRVAGLHDWLKNNLYAHGSKYTPLELLERITGSGLSLEPFFDHLNRKYGELYRL